MNSIKKAPKWAIRKIIYYAAAAVVAVLGAFGILSEVQVDQWVDQLDKIVPWAVGVLAPLLAGAKTNAGSDSTATSADVAGAATLAIDPLEIADATVRAIRAEERGEHDRTIVRPTVGYVYGRR